MPDEGESFQFILPPLQFGEEGAEDYFPGTILLGIRSDPDEPWVVSKNRSATSEGGSMDFDAEDYDPTKVSFLYDFPLIDGLEVRGKFYEIAGPLPQIAWDVEIKNVGRKTIEIGELGFPLAFNNFYDGFGWNDERLSKLWNSRVYIHKFVGGAASWLFAQRMTAESPGLLVFPGDDTGWEFYSHVRVSLTTIHQWEGIPVVYVHSKDTIEREEWQSWFNEHTPMILEPGDRRTIQTRFAPTDSDPHDGIYSKLTMCGRPAIKVLPSAVAPVDVGIALEVTGASPTKFFVSREAETEVDADESGGFCFVKPSEPGPLTVSFEDKHGRICHAHLLFTEPISAVIQRRAEWICENQVVNNSDSALNKAIVLSNISSSNLQAAESDFAEASGLECSLADALFLAEKNAVYPVAGEIRTIDNYVEQFLRERVQNPSNSAVASLLSGGLPCGFGRPMSYPHVANLYHSMARVATATGQTTRSPDEYLKLAARTVVAMFDHGWRLYVRSVGVLGFTRFYDLVEDLKRAELSKEAEEIEALISSKASELMDLDFPFAGESVMDTSGFEEIVAAAKLMGDDTALEKAVRCAYAARSLAPSWWWYGSDKRHWDEGDSSPSKALADHGEICLGHTTIPNSLIFFALLDRDYLVLPETYVRMAFGGILGPWALVRNDGAASMFYCPDLGSRQAGYNPYTGASGLGYYHYLRGAGSYVLPQADQGVLTFGCHYARENGTHLVRPWDGVGRRIVLRQIGASFDLSFGFLTELRLNANLRSFEATIMNLWVSSTRVTLIVTGLLCTAVIVGNQRIVAMDGRFEIPLDLPAQESTVVRVEVE